MCTERSGLHTQQRCDQRGFPDAAGTRADRVPRGRNSSDREVRCCLRPFLSTILWFLIVSNGLFGIWLDKGVGFLDLEQNKTIDFAPFVDECDAVEGEPTIHVCQ
jgi:hypothetical protein